MSAIILSTGHVFAPGSVVAIGPLEVSSHARFDVTGVGFTVPVAFALMPYEKPLVPNRDGLNREAISALHAEWTAECARRQREANEAVHQEAIRKLLP